MNSINKIVVLSLMLVALSACKSEIDNKPAATVKEPAKVEAVEAVKTDKVESAEKATEKPTAQADGKEATFIAEKSKIVFVGSKITGDHSGTFGKWTGKGWIGKDGLNRVEFKVEMASINADHPKLTKHLKSTDFFAVDKFPEAIFTSSKFEKKEDDKYAITGDLTMHGVTKTISFPATISAEGDMIKASTEFTVQRMDFGLTYPGRPDDLIKKEVLLKVDLAFKK